MDYLLDGINFYTTAASEYWQKWYKKNKKHFLKLVNSHKKIRRKKMQEMIDNAKDYPCIVCKIKFDPIAMDLLHRDGYEKNFSISSAKRLIYSIDKLKEELAKCDVICSNCHKKITFKDKTNNNNRTRHKLLKIIDKIKSVPCIVCKKSYPPYCMELDHFTDDKVASIARLVHDEAKMEIIEAELLKVRPICTVCHRIKTKKSNFV